MIKSKLNAPYIGPYLVVKRLNEVDYQIQRSQNVSPIVVHVDDLKPFYGVPPEDNWLTKTQEEAAQSDVTMDDTDRPMVSDDSPSQANNEEPDNPAAESGASGSTDEPEITADFQTLTVPGPPPPFRTMADCIPVPVSQPATRRSRRQRVPPSRFKDFVL